MNKVTVIGSINLDTNLRVAQMAKPGETIHAKEHYSAAGGKGANQAVAAARSGCAVSFVGAVGDDAPGKEMLALLKKENINLDGVKEVANESTGQAFITVDDSGQNSITIYSGANYAFDQDDIEQNSDLIAASDFVVAQFETPIEATIQGFKIARQNSAKTILNPAPAITEIPAELLQVTDIIIPNETEAATITGIEVVDEKSAKKAADKLHELGVSAVIITIGDKGAFYDFQDKQGLIPAFKVKAVDTTAAGDTFIGAMTSILKPDFSNLSDAITFANKASSLTVQGYGAQPSIPTKAEVEQVK
ncbi:ribokinase [Lactobacillus sp. ESL0263]|uniref:ribokinase n=1 Tax=Lactobacillus sp. ESL0263 TaxID=2069350 RepID=UPI000EFD1F46|nr:ribokinase [Lactobacillus sp. ESL0263]RMC48330.1 ribokinase [Lactobacillus sp. ESL0263]